MKILTDEELAEVLDREIFRKISTAADKLGVECYVVGGYVRDLFLERPSNDIDVVVVGSGIEVASELKRMLGRKARLGSGQESQPEHIPEFRHRPGEIRRHGSGVCGRAPGEL